MKKYVILFVLGIISLNSFSQSSTKRIAEFNLENKVALQGYDPVAYFTVKKAVKGKKEIAVSYEGVTYYFSNQSNKDAFLKNPANYEPQYGGWCAYAMGDSGEKVDVDPETFKIIDGKLYVFYNAFFNNTLKSWNKNEANLKKKADNNWKKFIQ
ncbi:YHS domain-containing (seleno)protein [Flavobacterium capsici]|uniref:YHS domain-containing (Seleno)protein n=1 Tax=Flavobacterium capsici TaxID=3075618 RepID=A0AA96EX53_9FLAO|nr:MULTISPECIES: YHS domain-containing (seleno)protein [unclassified Flavobacterium]WNM20079.1 YHS domain-containing (seleno)protein [Flavobacterium sp. PMR2A8]WNM21468.1 YHS domain-containing (seleno)protein [Flavobacterium sp. PMTSA4]